MNGDIVFDRVPPQNVEAEQAVLGAVIIDSDVLISVMEKIEANDFYKTTHQMVFQVMIELVEEQEPVDMVTVTARLKDKDQLEEVGGVSYLSELAKAVPTAANVDYYAAIVEEKSMLRRLIRTATQIVSSGYASDEDVTSLLSDAEQRILEISSEKS